MSSGHLGGVDLTRVRNDGMIGVDEIFGFGGKSCANCRQLFAFEPHYFTHPPVYFFLSLCRMLRLTSRRNSTRSTTRHGEDCVASADLVVSWNNTGMDTHSFPNAFALAFTFPSILDDSDACNFRHVIVGRNFGSYVTHETKHFIYFYLGQVAVLLFKSGWWIPLLKRMEATGVCCREKNTLGALINLLGNVCSASGLGVDDETG